MAKRFLNSEPFPGYLYEEPARLNFLTTLIDGSKADGIIFWHLKFCEPYNFDYPDLKRAFSDQGIPTYLIETEMQLSGVEQLKTRIQAFYETLTRRRT
jgi:benzoyl-CoA reductase/2-hydroxyglutaryl-CoA dehydratase subunit BcrC/BadD/HgdB